MHDPKLSSLLVSDFNIDVLAGYLSNSEESPVVSAAAAPFGMIIPTLLGAPFDGQKDNYDFAIVWSRPEAVIEGFSKAINFQEYSSEEIFSQIDQYVQAIRTLAQKTNTIFVPSWVIPTYFRGFGLLEWKESIGISRLLTEMNLHLAQGLNAVSNVYMLNTNKWIEGAGKDAFSTKLLYMGKIPFSQTVFKLAGQDIKAALRALNGAAKKLVIVDLDDTLWPGLVGNEGWQNLRLGGHDPIGEAFVDFQKALKSLTRRGIVLGIVSKNDEATALEAIDKHTAMVLKKEDFAGWRINWNDKAQNIMDLAAELNLGLQSIVFIDDSPFERARVAEALPEVFVPQWPEDKTLYAQTLLYLSCFDTPALSAEDVKRTQMYQEERLREQSKVQVGSIADWLSTLGIVIKIEELNSANLSRVTQLLNKTNQMNLSTRRMTESALLKWSSEPGHKLWAFSISDKFGDSGLTGLASVEVKGKQAKIVDFVLSCRVFGREAEETMTHTVFVFAKSLGLDSIIAEYLPTEKNSPCLKFFERSGFSRQGNVFQWSMDRDYPAPQHASVMFLTEKVVS